MRAQTGSQSALAAVLLLGALNTLSMADRYLLPSVQIAIQREFHVSDGRIGALSSAFLLAFLLAIPLVGWLGDRLPRTTLIGVGAVCWSGLTYATGLAHSFRQLYWLHVGVGFAEATLSILVLALLADFVPESRRTRVFAALAMTTPVGSALGFWLGGTLMQHGGWRLPFHVAGLVGLVVAIVQLLILPEQKRGSADTTPTSWERATLRGLRCNRTFVAVTCAMSALVFGMVGLAVWLPTYYVRFAGYSVPAAAKLVGLITLCSGVAGTWAGAMLSQTWQTRHGKASLLVSAWGLFLSAMLATLAILGPRWVLTPAVVSSAFFLFFNASPLNVALVNAVDARIRATAMSLALFCVHMFGDALSPGLIGYLSNRFSLRWALFAAVVAVAAGSAVLFAEVVAERRQN